MKFLFHQSFYLAKLFGHLRERLANMKI
uniref:Pco148683 n=1 Tax=Arundo donax TaxID=35708 RepID=A0A0A9FTG1_ARUDO